MKQILKQYYKMAKTVNKDIVIKKVPCDWSCYPALNTINVPMVVTEQGEQEFLQSVYDKIPIQYQELGTNINSIVWSFLHELGHIECGHTADRQKAKRWFANLLNKINSKTTQKWANNIYFNLEEEQEATRWAVRFAIIHYQEVKEFEKKLLKKYKEFYNRILTKKT